MAGVNADALVPVNAVLLLVLLRDDDEKNPLGLCGISGVEKEIDDRFSVVDAVILIGVSHKKANCAWSSVSNDGRSEEDDVYVEEDKESPLFLREGGRVNSMVGVVFTISCSNGLPE